MNLRMVKKLIVFTSVILISACNSNLENYKYVLKEEDVVCKEVKKEQTEKCGRFCSQYMTITSKCSFILTDDEYMQDYVKREKLKYIVNHSED